MERTVSMASAPAIMDSDYLGPLRLLQWLVPRAMRRLPAMLAVIATTLAAIGLDLLAPWPMKVLVDNVLLGQPLSSGLARLAILLPGTLTTYALLGWVIGATFMLFLLGWALGFAKGFASIAFGRQLDFDLSADVFEHLQALSLRFHRRSAIGDLMRRVTSDCGAASVIVRDAAIPSGSAIITLVGMFAVMWHLDRELALLALVVIPAMLISIRMYAGPMEKKSYNQQGVEAAMYALIEQTMSAISVVQAFGREKDGDRRFQASAGQLLSATLELTHAQLMFRVLVGVSTAVGTAAILWVGGQHVIDGRLSVGGVLVFLAYLRSFYSPLQTLAYAPATIQQAGGSARRVLEVLGNEPEIADRADAKDVTITRGELCFDHVTVGYERDRTILSDIELTAEPGRMVALVGRTGAGKTTLVSLVPRFMDPWSGRVTIDGVDIRDFSLRSLRRQVAIVSQDVFLFPRTVAENIAYGRPGAPDTDIEAAARAAQAHDFIERLPQGYQTVLGERGATLSGGERQRLSIARAFIADAPILILDEATSALDVATEAMLVLALANLTHGRTVLVIAHRMSTVRNAHHVIVLEDGRIVESGSPTELLAARGKYARFHALQSGFIDATPTGDGETA